MSPLPQTPFVSIVTPSYNTGRYIGETLRSVQAQGYPRLEHIVLDSGSTDQTPAVLAGFPNVTVISDAPAGMCEKVNLGFALAHGDVVAWLCADDFYLPGAIDKAVSALKANPQAGLVYCNSLQVDEHGVEVDRSRTRHAGHSELLHEQDYLPHPTVFMRREALNAVGLLDLRFPLACDWDLWIRMSREFPLLYVDDWWAAARKRPGQLSSRRLALWLQGRMMVRAHGGPLLRPRSWAHRGNALVHLAGNAIGGAWQAIDCKVRDLVRGAATR